MAEFSRVTRLKRTAVPLPSNWTTPQAKNLAVNKIHRIKPEFLSKAFKVPKFTESKAKKLKLQLSTATASAASTATAATAQMIKPSKAVALQTPKDQILVIGNFSSGQDTKNPDDSSQLKQALADHQLTIHNLQFEKKLLVKERDDLEKLLSDAEARNYELRDALREVLRQGFSSVKDFKREISSVLAENP